jgi:hypothetical protein
VLAVAFFRNLNLGHRGSPNRAQLLEAFAGAGCEDARSFQTNGTVIFHAAAPTSLARQAARALAPACGWDDVVVVRRARWLLDLADRMGDQPSTAEVTLFDSPAPFPHPTPWRPERGRIVVVAAGRDHTIGVNDLPNTAFGTPTAERLLGVRATSRACTTMHRLAGTLRSTIGS